MQKMVVAEALVFGWSYNVDIDLQSILKLRAVVGNQSAATKLMRGQIMVIGRTFEGSYEHNHALMVAARLLDKERLRKALSAAAFECATQAENTPVSLAMGALWSRNFSAVVDSETFDKHKRFPLAVEIRSISMQLKGIPNPMRSFPPDSKEYATYFNNLRKIGFDTTWDEYTCIYEKTRNSVEQWVSIGDIHNLQIHKDEIAAMEARLDDPEKLPARTPVLKADEFEPSDEEFLNVLAPNEQEAAAMSNLQLVSWNKGSKPLSMVFFPALILFTLWRLLKAVFVLLRGTKRLVFR
jgi:hypothetical protein